MYPRRSKSGYTTFLSEYYTGKNVYVVCPSCNKKAIVNANAMAGSSFTKEAKVACGYCGYNKIAHTKTFYISQYGIDPYFQIPLWLVIECCGHILWAYNEYHLEYLKVHINARLKERDVSITYNSSLGSRLPQWMTSAKNKEHVLKALKKLELKL